MRGVRMCRVTCKVQHDLFLNHHPVVSSSVEAEWLKVGFPSLRMSLDRPLMPTAVWPLVPCSCRLKNQRAHSIQRAR